MYAGTEGGILHKLEQEFKSQSVIPSQNKHAWGCQHCHALYDETRHALKHLYRTFVCEAKRNESQREMMQDVKRDGGIRQQQSNREYGEDNAIHYEYESQELYVELYSIRGMNSIVDIYWDRPWM